MFRGCQESAETIFSPQLAHVDDFTMEEGSQEDLVCECVEANPKSPQLIDPGISESNKLWSPTAQLVEMVLGARPRINVSGAQLKVTNSKFHGRSEEQEDEQGAASEWPFHLLLFENDFYSDDWWREELRGKYGIAKDTTADKCVKLLNTVPCKWAMLILLYYFLLLFCSSCL